MKVTYWSDYACPYCYIGETNLKKAAEDLGIDLDLEMKAFELDPNKIEGDLTAPERLAKKYQISTQEALDKIASINTMARESGINLDYTGARPSNTFDAHRLTKYAQQKGVADELSEALYEAYFKNGKRLADRDVLVEAGKKAGLGEDEIIQVLDSEDFVPEVRVDEIVAQNNGISAVPFFIVDGRYAIPGAMDVEQFKEVLNKVNELE